MPDLRTIKTKKSIENAFLELRQKKNLEDIKVSELCSIALINKTTFYNYYSDIYELSNELEEKYLQQCFLGFNGYDCLFKNTEKFIKGIYNSFNNNNTIQILFSNRINMLVEKTQKYLLEFYKKEINTDEKTMCVIFIIQGAFILLNYKSKQEEKLNLLIDIATNIIKQKL